VVPIPELGRDPHAVSHVTTLTKRRRTLDLLPGTLHEVRSEQDAWKDRR
jgi:hypothetical protein